MYQHADGFVHADPSGGKWYDAAQGNGPPAIIANAESHSGYEVESVASFSAGWWWVLKSNQQVIIQGARRKISDSVITDAGLVFSVYDGATLQCELRQNINGALYLTRNGTAITPATGAALSANGVLNVQNFYFIEWKVTIADIGAWEVRVDGNTVITGTGDTKNTANAYGSRVLYDGAGQACRWRDCYLLDGSGGIDDNFWGDIQIVRGRPNGNGYLNNGVGVGSATQWQNIDEIPVNTADYNQMTAAGEIESYTTDLAVSPTKTVKGVIVDVDANKTVAGPGLMELGLRSAGVNGFETPGHSLTTTSARRHSYFRLDPATGALWVPGAANSAQILIRLTDQP